MLKINPDLEVNAGNYNKNYNNITNLQIKRKGIVKRVKPRLSITRNEPCLCGSGLKFKKCCNNDL